MLLIIMDLSANCHRHMVSFQLHLKTWYELLKGEIADMVDPTNKPGVHISGVPKAQNSTVIAVQAKTIHYVKAFCIYHTDPD